MTNKVIPFLFLLLGKAVARVRVIPTRYGINGVSPLARRELAFGDDLSKIFGGTIVTDAAQIPAFALLCLEQACSSLTCGGTLITSTHVLTAGHCIRDTSGAETTIAGVRVGSTTRSDGTYVTVASQTIHPSYPATPAVDSLNDIAILTLSTPITTITPQTINLNTAYPTGTTTVPVTAYGYGGIDEAGTVSTELRTAAETVQTDATCTASHANYDASLQVCTESATVGICGGDSGGPIVDANGVQLGLLSYGSAFCNVGTADVWTDVAAYETWIRSIATTLPTTTPAPTTVAPGSTPSPTTAAPASTPAPNAPSAPNPRPTRRPTIIRRVMMRRRMRNRERRRGRRMRRDQRDRRRRGRRGRGSSKSSKSSNRGRGGITRMARNRQRMRMRRCRGFANQRGDCFVIG